MVMDIKKIIIIGVLFLFVVSIFIMPKAEAKLTDEKSLKIKKYLKAQYPSKDFTINKDKTIDYVKNNNHYVYEIIETSTGKTWLVFVKKIKVDSQVLP